jgi:hypothetical protein
MAPLALAKSFENSHFLLACDSLHMVQAIEGAAYSPVLYAIRHVCVTLCIRFVVSC